MKINKPDYILVAVAAILIILGILILASVSGPLSWEKYGKPHYFLNHQLLYGLIPGIFLALLAFKIPLDFLKKWAPFFLLINLVLLGMVFLPKIGMKFRGAARWLDLGPVSFQPSEFLKLTFILYLASWLNSRTQSKKSLQREKIWSQTLLAFIIIIGLVGLFLIFQPNIGNLGIIVLVATFMYFSANTPLWHSILIVLIGAGGLLTLIKLAPYRAARLSVFLNPEIDPLGKGYQLKQALIAIGSGGIFGLGLGISRQRFGFLPQSMTDAIFAIFAEETGFVGAIILIFIFLMFLWSAFRISKKISDKFSKLTVLGISSWICLQAFVNIGSMLRIVPLTGLALPFISYGGSHLIAELIGVGILLNISKQI